MAKKQEITRDPIVLFNLKRLDAFFKDKGGSITRNDFSTFLRRQTKSERDAIIKLIKGLDLTHESPYIIQLLNSGILEYKINILNNKTPEPITPKSKDSYKRLTEIAVKLHELWESTYSKGIPVSEKEKFYKQCGFRLAQTASKNKGFINPSMITATSITLEMAENIFDDVYLRYIWADDCNRFVLDFTKECGIKLVDADVQHITNFYIRVRKVWENNFEWNYTMFKQQCGFNKGFKPFYLSESKAQQIEDFITTERQRIELSMYY